ncbi:MULTISPECIES: KEOPS complex subunit Cgi121 [unclassified Halorhabdus]|uniref:KEOPS complex subunit Cgi121 n=1 Tax=unclassified Halorhabdus TaxID=2621901 RepID=UPI0023DB1255|nr:MULTISPECIES: KEOPS complex subunit Cgi121 [unclassified Halorhabdus]WEL18571.1 KEOPS complex subunit Cgi121 [Halorhabdus sp. SVX81]WEL22459.1 KEOPS complex subunit Cgi121 [Halorhabdus sp. BNX81]
MEVIEGTLRIDELDAFLDRLDAIGNEHGVAVQAFDARYVAGREHLRRACELADRAHARDEMIARDPGVEILLYAAGRRQIQDALTMGVSRGEQPAVVVCHAVGGRQSAGGGDSVTERERAARTVVEAMECIGSAETLGLSDPELIADFFDITDAERAATDATLSDLVCERVAMLVVEK